MKKIYVSPFAEILTLNVKGDIMDKNLGNSDHTTTGGNTGGGPGRGGVGSKEDDFWEEEEDESPWGNVW